jgi:hypothetical protein
MSTSKNTGESFDPTIIGQIITRLASMEDDRGVAANVKALDFSLMEIQFREI